MTELKHWKVLTIVSSLAAVLFIIVSVIMTEKYKDATIINEQFSKKYIASQQKLTELRSKQFIVIHEFENEIALMIKKGQVKKMEMEVKIVKLEVRNEILKADLKYTKLAGEAKLNQIKEKLNVIINGIGD
jgi:hypothetical protein